MSRDPHAGRKTTTLSKLLYKGHSGSRFGFDVLTRGAIMCSHHISFLLNFDNYCLISSSLTSGTSGNEACGRAMHSYKNIGMSLAEYCGAELPVRQDL
jgi:hypothetical protein